MGPGFDQEIHQACGFSRVESVDTKNPQHIGRFKCTFIIGSHFPPLLFPHSARIHQSSELCAARD